jgi:prepilin-type N-terminal cleavage/methylation domain-containing protein
MMRRVRGRARGFTLAELMAVVAIMGVLSALAVAAFNRRAYQSDTTNAKVVVKSIAVAEEHYRAENQVYLNVSAAGDPGWYPQKTFTRMTRVPFWRAPPDAGADAETTAWQALMPDVRQQVTYGFKVNAGLPTAAPSTVLDPASGVTLPTANPVEPWYLIQARSDFDADGLASYIVAASWTPEVIVVNEGE